MSTEIEILEALNEQYKGAWIQGFSKPGPGALTVSIEKKEGGSVMLTFSAKQGVHLETGQVRVTLSLDVNCPGLQLGG